MSTMNTPDTEDLYIDTLPKISAIIERLKSELTPRISNEQIRWKRKIRIPLSEGEWNELSQYMKGSKKTLWQGSSLVELKRYEWNTPCLRIEVLNDLDSFARLPSLDPLDDLVFHFHDTVLNLSHREEPTPSKNIIWRVSAEARKIVKKLT